MIPLVAWRVGSQPFYTYTLLLDLGLLIAVAGLAVEGNRRGWSPAEVLEALAWALLPGMLAGRAAYAAGLGIPLWQGAPWGEGLSFAAALAGGALGLALLALVRRRSYWQLLGAVVPGLALGQALGWLGAAAHGVSAGAPLAPGTWWAPRLRDLYGTELPRFPVQYLAALASLAAWAIMARLRPGDRGRTAGYAIVVGVSLALLCGHVEQRQPLLAGLSFDQAVYSALALAGAALAATLALRQAGRRRTRGPHQELCRPGRGAAPPPCHPEWRGTAESGQWPGGHPSR